MRLTPAYLPDNLDRAEAKVHDADGNLVAMGTGAFRVFEKKGSAIV